MRVVPRLLVSTNGPTSSAHGVAGVSRAAALQPGDFVVAVIAFAFFQAPAAPASARSRHSLKLAIETFVSRATSSSGSPRNSRATIAILR